MYKVEVTATDANGEAVKLSFDVEVPDSETVKRVLMTALQRGFDSIKKLRGLGGVKTSNWVQ